MNTQQIDTALQKALNINLEKAAKEAGTNEHNLKEEWSAVVAKAEEFAGKYVKN